MQSAKRKTQSAERKPASVVIRLIPHLMVLSGLACFALWLLLETTAPGQPSRAIVRFTIDRVDYGVDIEAQSVFHPGQISFWQNDSRDEVDERDLFVIRTRRQLVPAKPRPINPKAQRI